MNFMEKSNEELLLIVRQQEETLKKYKSRLQDVVAAYKRLTIEKESLESGLIATVENKDEKHLSSTRANDDTTNLQSRINTLAQSLADLTVEKSRTESDFQAVRRNLLQQIKMKEDNINELKTQLEKEKKIHDTITEDIKSELMLEYRKQDSRQLAIIRELQELVSVERKHKGHKDAQIEELKDQLSKKSLEVTELKKSNKALRSEMERTKSADDIDNPADDKSSAYILNKLKEELKDIQERHNHSVHQGQHRVAELEERSRLLVASHENRVSRLEGQLTELTNLISDYDRSRQADQEEIHKLKNRLLHLEIDNTNSACEDDRTALTREEMIGQLKHLKNLLIRNSKTPEQWNQFRETILEDLHSVESLRPYFEYINVEPITSRSDFEKLKQDSDRRSKEEISSLKKRIVNLETRNVELEKINLSIGKQNGDIKKELEVRVNSYREKLKNCEIAYKKKFINAEEELLKETNRLTTLIAERDKQIEMLKNTHDFLDDMQPKEVETDEDIDKVKNGDERNLSKLFHYAHDDARKEAEICRLRQNNNELENKLYNLQKEMCIREDKLQRYVAELKNDICKLERSISLKDEVNIEYLKNVVVSYLSTVDTNKRTHMLNAIFTILHFTDKEVDRIRNYRFSS